MIAGRTLPDAAALIGWIDQPSLVPFRQHLGAELGSCFRNVVIEQMLADTAQNDGTHFETFRRINVLARQ